MQSTPQPLPEDPVILHGIISQLSDQLAESERERCAQASALEQQTSTLEQHVQRIDQLLEDIELLRRKRFGPSTDRIPASQLGLFDETELEALIGELEAELPADTPKESDTDTGEPKPPKRGPVRRPLPSHLPRVARIIDLSDEEKPTFGEDWTFIGYDTSEQLAVIPRQSYVIEYKRAQYVARDEEVPGAEVGVKIAPRPAQIIPKSIAHSSLLAAIVTRKFVDALPLYRQEQIFAREGITLSRQTLSGLLMRLQAPLKPVAAAFKALLRQGPVVHVDETPCRCCARLTARPSRSPTCGCSAAARRTNRCVGSNTPRAARRMCRSGSCSRLTPNHRCRSICTPMATVPTTSWPMRPRSSVMPAAGRMCSASSSRPPPGATLVPRSGWSP